MRAAITPFRTFCRNNNAAGLIVCHTNKKSAVAGRQRLADSADLWDLARLAPTKLEDFNVHNDTIYSSGTVVTGRICYDAFVLDNKKKGIYYQATT